MQEANAAQSVAGSVRQTLTNLEAYHDKLDKKESSLEKIRSLTQNLEAYEKELERSLKAIEWFESNRGCELGYSDSTGEWIVYRDGQRVCHGSSVLGALEDASEK
jgi:hypothetical protein